GGGGAVGEEGRGAGGGGDVLDAREDVARDLGEVERRGERAQGGVEGGHLTEPALEIGRGGCRHLCVAVARRRRARQARRVHARAWMSYGRVMRASCRSARRRRPAAFRPGRGRGPRAAAAPGPPSTASRGPRRRRAAARR